MELIQLISNSIYKPTIFNTCNSEIKCESILYNAYNGYIDRIVPWYLMYARDIRPVEILKYLIYIMINYNNSSMLNKLSNNIKYLIICNAYSIIINVNDILYISIKHFPLIDNSIEQNIKSLNSDNRFCNYRFDPRYNHHFLYIRKNL
jgi:hypothetical protein